MRDPTIDVRIQLEGRGHSGLGLVWSIVPGIDIDVQLDALCSSLKEVLSKAQGSECVVLSGGSNDSSAPVDQAAGAVHSQPDSSSLTMATATARSDV